MASLTPDEQLSASMPTSTDQIQRDLVLISDPFARAPATGPVLEDSPSSYGLSFPEAGNSTLPSTGQLQSELSSVTTTSRSSLKKANTVAVSPMLKSSNTTQDFKMTLTSKQNPDDVLWVLVSPSIDEERSAIYDSQQPVHHPGSIQVYKNTSARTFNATFKLISRTSDEASTNLDNINLIRSWVMPYYGQGTANSSSKDKLGAPPDILIFDVYGDKNISNLPIVLTHYHWVYPDNVDYIPTNDGIPFPTIIDISLSMIEAYSPEEFTGFDITKYKTGDMISAYTFSSVPASETSTGDSTPPSPRFEQQQQFGVIV